MGGVNISGISIDYSYADLGVFDQVNMFIKKPIFKGFAKLFFSCLQYFLLCIIANAMDREQETE